MVALEGLFHPSIRMFDPWLRTKGAYPDPRSKINDHNARLLVENDTLMLLFMDLAGYMVATGRTSHNPQVMKRPPTGKEGLEQSC